MKAKDISIKPDSTEIGKAAGERILKPCHADKLRCHTHF